MRNKKLHKSLKWAIIDYTLTAIIAIILAIRSFSVDTEEKTHEISQEAFISDCIDDEFGVEYCENLYLTKDY